MTPLDLFGLIAVTLMLAFYALEKRHHIFVLLFAGSCLLGSTYGFLQGAWPFGLVELIWGGVAGWKWWKGYSAPPATPSLNTGDCGNCGHPIGYHHLDDDRCSCKNCDCPGYLGVPKAPAR